MPNTNESHAAEDKNLPKPVPFNWRTHDGLKLAGVDWRQRQPNSQLNKIPVLCLPGLSRNTRDFNDVARFLQSHGHRVIALDYRGRGLSDWDSDWQNYSLPVEQTDITAAIEELQLDRFALLGTSRGGLHALLMSQNYPSNRMAAVIFNDIGPQIDMRGLQRIASSLDRPMAYASQNEIALWLQQSLSSQFPEFTKAEWLKLAGQLASEKNGKFVFDYDPSLTRQFDDLDPDNPLPDLWPLYKTLADRPVFVLRGEFSDLLNIETCHQMTQDHPDAGLKVISKQGHAPVLWEPEVHSAILDFVEDL
ncbi:MAG: alpha/beta hydrolase [Roseibium sp.]